MFIVSNIKYDKIKYLMDWWECIDIDVYSCDSDMMFHAFEDTAYSIPCENGHSDNDSDRSPTDWRIHKWHMG